jgi:hypothetical protein
VYGNPSKYSGLAMRKPRRKLHVEELETRTLLSGGLPSFSHLGSGVVASESGHTAAPTVNTNSMPSPTEIASALKLVEADLAKHGVTWGVGVRLVTNDALSKEFPNQIFFSVLFWQFPVGRIVPAPYKAADIYAVTRGQVPRLQLVTDIESMQSFFQQHLSAVTTRSNAREAILAWLALAPHLLQDGFYTFQLLTDSIKAWVGKSGLQASGQVVVMAGGNGMINATLTFDARGRLTTANQQADIVSGPRPICQSTLLLHRNPLVRRMAEQDLLVMGLAARDYLAEQRSRAGPKLQRAIDRIWQRICDRGR